MTVGIIGSLTVDVFPSGPDRNGDAAVHSRIGRYADREMSWMIAGGPESTPSSERNDRRWTWLLESEDGQRRERVEVVVSDLARDTTHARAALTSSGRVAVAEVLEWQEPPRRIRCTLVGFVVEGGER